MSSGRNRSLPRLLGPGEIGVVAKLKETYTGDTLCEEGHPIIFEKAKFAEPLIAYAIAPKSKGDEEKVGSGIHRILEEDPTLKFQRDEETKEMLLSGMGQVHLEVSLQRLKRKFGVDVLMKTPKVPYRETIKVATKAQGRYKKQSGGRGQYGDCWLEVEPMPRGGGYEFADRIVGGVIPQQYRPAVEKGVVETMKEGVVAGYPIVDIKVTLFDGSYHSVDSSEMAFKIAGSMALKKAIQEAKPILLEPVMKVEVIIARRYSRRYHWRSEFQERKSAGGRTPGRRQPEDILPSFPCPKCLPMPTSCIVLLPDAAYTRWNLPSTRNCPAT